MAHFADKVIIVTGASEGIGRALCLELAPQKPRLVIAARNADRLNSLREECEGLGAEVLVVPTDVTDKVQCKALVEKAVEHFGGIDVLVNNAGGTMWTLLEDVEDVELFERLIYLNYLSAVYCTYYAIHHIMQRKGLVVALSSVAGMIGVPTRTGYSAAKHALFGFFDSLRIEMRRHGVGVLVAAPDFVLSEIHRRALGSDGKALGKSPLQEDKIMTSEECARLIVPAMERRERLLLTSSRGKLGRYLKVFAPNFMDKLAEKAIAEKK
ncbi:MAG: SDR family oxidoreductase [Candidatus Hydrogenedentes bacterium]|nr:SDR family oxidoreductase [Candidatus Hydrogenedentota bacterium]